MWMAAGYFDESTDTGEQLCYAVAGYISYQRYTVHLELNWKALLDHWNMRYFKASELEFGMGEFRQYRDDPNQLSLPLSKREKELIVTIKSSFIDLIVDEDQLKGYACAIVLRDLRKLENGRPELFSLLPAPYLLASQVILVDLGLDYLEWNKDEQSAQECTLIRPVFDSHEQWETRMRGGFDMFRHNNPNASKVILDPIYEDDSKYLCLQAADCLAYEARRLVEAHAYAGQPSVRKAMARMGKHVQKIYYLDYDALVTIAEWQTADTIAIAPLIDNTKRPTRAKLIRNSA